MTAKRQRLTPVIVARPESGVARRYFAPLHAAMIGAEAGEAMAAIQTAMPDAVPYTKLRDAIITHLTVAEGF